ncbi:DUF2796 domain-containing protein [Pseudomonas sp. LRF_L74]|uniref:DUF2796 domain-containing protein n=1 Tax=Pseudomonas sp. LRF_L74 TaxID=3369422 RepID=UPI003F5D67E1
MRRILLALPFALLPLAAAQAHEHDHEEHGSLGKHEHGVASLNVALDGRTLEIELQSPAMNIVGFEHAATSDADKASAAAAKARLQKPLELFALSAAACTIQENQVKSPLFGDKAEAHEHEHADEHEHAHEHADVDADYAFTCDKADALKTLDLSAFFLQFPATEKINVQLIGPSGQKGAQLTKTEPRLAF